jgi:DNA/RNA-binding domain of Phe-tRNA-synthetase-like protein
MAATESTVLELSPEWREGYPGAAIGVLAIEGVANPEQHPPLDRMKGALVQELLGRYAGEDRQSLRELPTLAAYDAYYRQFGQTYHVQHQLESVVFKGKALPSGAALVEAMFMAELDNLLLTAGHDLDAVEGPMRIGVATGDESYTRISGKEQSLKTGDMMIGDRRGVISCILYGPDRRTRIRPETERVVFTVYAPAGVAPQDVRHHLEALRANVAVVAPEATVAAIEVHGAS